MSLPQLRPLGPGTLGRRLLLRVVGLVAALAVLLSLVSTLATRQLLVGQIDQQLVAAVSRQERGGADNRRNQPPGGVDLPGQVIGTVVVEEHDSWVIAGMLTEDGPRNLADADAITQLMGLPSDGGKRSVRIDDLGHYRVMSFSRSGVDIVVGIPLTQTDHTVGQLIGLSVLLTVLALLGSALAVRSVVVRSLRPLNRLAATATQVSGLKLDSGEVDLSVRVAAADADPGTEVGQVGSALNHMLGNVEGALAARQASETKVRQFVADASHELRNPLAAIRGYAELTGRYGDELPADVAFAVGRVRAESERMSRLVEDLLLLARLDADQEVAGHGGGRRPGALELTPTDLTELVVNAVSDARVAGREHEWSLDLAPVPVRTLADRYRLQQVVTNLLANARTHTPAGTRVLTRLRAVDGYAELSVLDDGPGIDPELLPHVFERFTRADASRARAQGAAAGTSTGLGLAIVDAVVQGHHGRTEVASGPDGTRITVRIPLSGG